MIVAILSLNSIYWWQVFISNWSRRTEINFDNLDFSEGHDDHIKILDAAEHDLMIQQPAFTYNRWSTLSGFYLLNTAGSLVDRLLPLGSSTSEVRCPSLFGVCIAGWVLVSPFTKLEFGAFPRLYLHNVHSVDFFKRATLALHDGKVDKTRSEQQASREHIAKLEVNSTDDERGKKCEEEVP